VASSLAGEKSATLPVVGRKEEEGGFTSGQKQLAQTEEAGAEASSGWLENGRQLQFGKGCHRAQWQRPYRRWWHRSVAARTWYCDREMEEGVRLVEEGSIAMTEQLTGVRRRWRGEELQR
jgi:hypothetical protein